MMTEHQLAYTFNRYGSFERFAVFPDKDCQDRWTVLVLLDKGTEVLFTTALMLHDSTQSWRIWPFHIFSILDPL